MRAIIASFVAWFATISFAADEKSQIEAFFSPDGGCASAITGALTKARSNILVQAYSFTSKPIAKALVDAHKRGVRVQVILDPGKTTEEPSSADYLHHAGIPCFIDAKEGKAHNKIMVIDRETVITGSFNFIKAAEERNAENLLIIHDRNLANRYTTNWNAHVLHSQPYSSRKK